MKCLADCRLYTFIDAAYLGKRSPVEVAQQLCDGGSDLIQIRSKGSSENEIARLVQQVLPVTSQAAVGLVVNDFPRVASRAGAQLAHLGQEDFFDAGFNHVSELLAPCSPLKIGLSTHAPDQAERAVRAGADYVAIGPVYPTPTKPSALPVTLEYVRWAASCLTIPWFAIGGITLANLDEVLEVGARRICVVSAILNRKDIAHACHEFKERLRSAPL